MKLQDKGSCSGIAGLITVFIFAAIFIFSKFSSVENPIVKPRTHSAIQSERFFTALDSLQTKIKGFDPSIGNFKSMPSDSIFYEAKDDGHNRIQVAGSNNSIGELTWIWNHGYKDNLKKGIISNFGNISKMMCGQAGQQWVLKELQKKAAPDKPIMEYATINYNQVQFFNDGLSTVTLKIIIL
ncbi:hypothetical protein BDD43_5318 [Mucilaginibacter gracilis]|uniref:Uncharacterized protein n=1 Tax=Mucilaginibacter gracilis TaxID=423350 RepID=A0A495J9K0_9SPHI|nr:hypothetical protein [Mucilaginibacter gracilis]RKR85062.1 hypothetical protein BDD43_5318 [Mucilaginibacter gracilis]